MRARICGNGNKSGMRRARARARGKGNAGRKGKEGKELKLEASARWIARRLGEWQRAAGPGPRRYRTTSVLAFVVISLFSANALGMRSTLWRFASHLLFHIFTLHTHTLTHLAYGQIEEQN